MLAHLDGACLPSTASRLMASSLLQGLLPQAERSTLAKVKEFVLGL